MNWPWRYVAVHHSATPDGRTLSADEIRRFHVTDDDPATPLPEGRGWRDIGYHAVAEMVEDEAICIVGRPWTEQGSHAPPHNTDALGICFVGDYSLRPPLAGLLEVAARRVIAPWINLFNMDFPGCLKMHRELSAPGHTACPGAAFNFGLLRELVARSLGYVT